MVQNNSSMFEVPAFLPPTDLGLPMHSPSAQTEHVSLNLARFLFLLNNVRISGRGVLQLIRQHTLLNLLLYAPSIAADLLILARPEAESAMAAPLCGCLEWAVTFSWINSTFRGLAIALAR